MVDYGSFILFLVGVIIVLVTVIIILANTVITANEYYDCKQTIVVKNHREYTKKDLKCIQIINEVEKGKKI